MEPGIPSGPRRMLCRVLRSSIPRGSWGGIAPGNNEAMMGFQAGAVRRDGWFAIGISATRNDESVVHIQDGAVRCDILLEIGGHRILGRLGTLDQSLNKEVVLGDRPRN